MFSQKASVGLALILVWASLNLANQVGADETRSAADAVVLVVVEHPAKTATVPGIVAHQGDKQAYVVCYVNTSSFGPRTDKHPSNDAKIKVLYGRNFQKSASGEVIQFKGNWLIRVPTSGIVADTRSVAAKKIIESMPVHVVGFPLTPDVRPANRIAQASTLARVFYRSVQHIEFIELAEPLEQLHVGMAISQTGEAVGYRMRTSHNNARWLPIEKLDAYFEPKFGGTWYAPMRGDEETVRYQFMTSLSDPFQRVHDFELRVKFVGADYRWTRPRPNQPVEGATRLKLVQAQPAEIVFGQLKQYAHWSNTQPTTWITEIDQPHPGDFDKLKCVIQIAYKDENGKAVYGGPSVVSYSRPRRRFNVDPPPVPDIPGLKIQ